MSLSESNIIFPHLSNTPNLSSTLTSLKRSTLSTHNRLNSIISDSHFVISVAEAYNLPLVANERCGSWYIPPESKVGSVYYKSTDGHMGQWAFSLRRLNLQLLDVVNQHGGAVIVDSTRRGKSMPDALSKTVPMWCCVMNRAIFGADGTHELFTPPQAVGESEHTQMNKRIDGFVKQFLEICKPNIQTLRSKVQKPLRPIWVTQKSSIPEEVPSFLEFHPIILCTASRRVEGAEVSEHGYIQGAADDHEAWSHGLTPTVFWKNKDALMSSNEDEVSQLVARLLDQEANTATTVAATLVEPTSSIYISSSHNVDTTGFNVVISCTPEELSSSWLGTVSPKNYLHLKCQQGKLGSRDLRSELSKLDPFLATLNTTSSPKVLMCCPTGKDLAVGTALAVLCRYVDDAGKVDLHTQHKTTDMNKNFIKQRLSWITTSNPSLNPSRATLQSVNAALLTSQDPKAVQATLPIRPKATEEGSTTPGSDEAKKGLLKPPPPPPPPPPPTPPSNAETIFSKLSKHSWMFRRTLTSALATHPSGKVTGTATFTPCALPAHRPPTLLYAEEGDFVTDNGLRFTARRKYVYQLVESSAEGDAQTTIVVRFFDDEKAVKGERDRELGGNGEGIGGLFVEMGALRSIASGGDEASLEATNREQHLCAEDLYGASWKFGAGMLDLGQGEENETWWEVRYDVKGPKKDYVSVTRYEKSS